MIHVEVIYGGAITRRATYMIDSLIDFKPPKRGKYYHIPQELKGGLTYLSTPRPKPVPPRLLGWTHTLWHAQNYCVPG